MIAAPLIIHFLLAGIGFTLALRARRSAMLCIYLGYVAVVALAGIPLVKFASPEVYRLAFFAVELAHNAILLLLAVQTIAELVPGRAVVPWCVFWLALLIIGAIKASLSNAAMLNLAVSSDMAVCGVLMLVLFQDVHWTRRDALTVAGIALVAIAGATPEIRLLQDQPAFRTAMQWADVPGLIIMAVAAHGREKLQ